MSEKTIDPGEVWERLYVEGHGANRYPWDVIVSFVMRNRPADTAGSACY